LLKDISPLIFVILGWFVLFNGAKYIASRSEAKSLINELNDFIDEILTENITFWLKVTKSEDICHVFLQQNLLKVKKLRVYEVALRKYNLEVLDYSDLKRIKELLTLTPDSEIRADTSKLKQFVTKKKIETQRLHSKLIDQIYGAFSSNYPPVTTPIFTNLI